MPADTLSDLPKSCLPLRVTFDAERCRPVVQAFSERSFSASHRGEQKVGNREFDLILKSRIAFAFDLPEVGWFMTYKSPYANHG